MSATEHQAGIPRWQIITGYVLSGLPGVAFLPSAYMKLAQPAGFLANWTKNYPAGSALPLALFAYTLSNGGAAPLPVALICIGGRGP